MRRRRSRCRGGVIPLVGVVVSLAACAGRRPPAGPPATGDEAGGALGLEVVALEVLPTGNPLPGDQGFAVGGLSGCAADAGSGRVLVVSDDRDRPRVFELDVRAEAEELAVVVAGVRRVADRRVGAARPEALDLEGVVVLRDGDMVVSSEGGPDGSEPAPPAITRHAPDGFLIERLVVPEQFLPAGLEDMPRGVRANLAFESLTRTPDGRLLTASEGPLVQDGDLPGFGESALVRLLEYVPDGGTWRPGRQFAYATSPVAQPDGFGPSTLSTGVAELLSLDGDRLLVLERSYVSERVPARRGFNVLRVFEVSLHDAEDVSGVPSLRGRQVRTLDKRLVLDLDALKPRLASELPTLENFEAMCYGPRLHDGSASLLLISDNNFNRRQKTVFLLFKVREPGYR